MISIDQTKKCFEVELDKMAEEYQVLFATAIINPHGPTFSVYYIDPVNQSISSNLYQVNIHPISDSIQNVASVKWGENNRIVIGIDFFADFFKGSMPTLFMKGNLLDSHFFNQILKLFISSKVDCLKTYQYVKQFEGKPYQRVSAEMKGALESILAEKKEKPVGLIQKLFTTKNKEIVEIDDLDFIRMLSNENNVIEEIKALFMAYNGSIQNIIPAGMVQIDFKAFLNVFAHVASQCNIDFNKLSK